MWVTAGQEWAQERKGEKLDSEEEHWARGCCGLTRFVLFGYERNHSLFAEEKCRWTRKFECPGAEEAGWSEGTARRVGERALSGPGTQDPAASRPPADRSVPPGRGARTRGGCGKEVGVCVCV